jgi:phosphate transport system substrate-binding protein
MRRKLLWGWMLGLLAGTALSVGCDVVPPPATKGGTTPAAAGPGHTVSGKLEIDGSSTVFKLTQAVAQEFSKVNPGVSIKVDKSGTGGGFKKFVTGQLDVCDASRPITEKEMTDCQSHGVEYIELPVCFDALTIAVNEQNTWCKDITTEELKKLWEPAPEGKDHPVTKWSDLRKEWPADKITLFGAGTDSGTFEYFTEAIVNKKNSSRADYTASEDDNTIVLGIEGDKNALGYVPYAYFAPRESTLNAVGVSWDKNPAGSEAVLPSRETVEGAKYNPLSRPLFIYVNRKSAERPEVKAFVEFYMQNGGQMAVRVKYIPLKQQAYDMGLARFGELKTGTGFGGHTEFGLPVEEILKREPKS